MTSGTVPARGESVHYAHTQIGWWGLGIIGGAAVLVVAVIGGIGAARGAPGGAMIAGMVAVALVVSMLVFSTLNVRIADGSLQWRFGPGLFDGRIPLAEIARVSPTRLPLWVGLGIHWWPGRGWVYNVSGRHAVEVVQRDGKATFIGTDEPEALARAIEAAIARPR